jgi:hypothetical protein
MNGETRPIRLRLFRTWYCVGGDVFVGKAELHRERPERINVCPFEPAHLLAALR